MKEQIVMTKEEYETREENLREEIIRELEFKYRILPKWTPIFIIFLFGYLMPKLLFGYDEFPKLTMFVFTLASMTYCFMIYSYVIMWKRRTLN